MKQIIQTLSLLLALLYAPGVMAATLFAPAITNNASPAYTTPDALLTVRGYANSNATVTANLGQQGTWFGVTGGGNASAVDTTKSVTLQFAPSAALYSLGHVWTRSRVIISGFAADPGFTDSAGYASGVSYANGTLTYFYSWDSGTEHVFTFTNPVASAGRTLRLNVFDTTSGWQATITRIEYTPTPTPAVADLAAPAQTMDNFSASDSWSMQVVGLWSDPNKNTIADLLFSTNRGIGLSAWRFNLAAGFDPTVSASSPGWQPWRTENGFLVSSNNYDWTRQPGQRWFLSAAKARGVDQYIAMVYSPPTNFTRNGLVYSTDTTYSSNLKPGYEPAFAKFLGDVLAHFQTNPVVTEQVAFNYVMPINEPQWDWYLTTSQEGCRYGNSDILNLIPAVSTSLATRGLTTQIIVPEAGDLTALYQQNSFKYGQSYGNYLSSLNSITNLISRNLSAHSYFTDNVTNQLVSIRQTLKTQMAANPFWRYWQTEYCILGTAGPGRDLTMTTALNVSRVIWADVAVANASAWHWWLSLSPADYKDGLLYTDYFSPGDAESLYCSKNFWAFGQWSRFIRPGWKRVAMSGSADVFGLMSAAFVAPTSNSLALVFVNAGSVNKLITPDATGLGAGNGIVYWSPWITSAMPSDNLSPLPPCAPGSTCMVPTNSVITYVATIMNTNSAAALTITSTPNQKAASGQLAYAVATFTSGVVPASLLKITATSDNPTLLPATNIVVSNQFMTGSITREFFTNFSGSGLGNLAAAPFFPNSPSSVTAVGLFEAPQNIGGNYGARMRGYVVAPQTGSYTFWISSSGASQLYLSTDENPINKSLIACVTNYTASREWDKEVNQKSVAMPLVAGQRYYIEAIHSANGGGDNLAVGWQLPDTTMARPISGARLMPWSDPYTNTTQRLILMQLATNQPGSVNVSLVATDTLGRSVTNKFSLSVVTNYVHPTSQVSGSTTLCGGGPALIQVALTGTPPWTLIWSDGFVQTTNASPATRIVQPASTTIYSLMAMYDTNGPALAGDRTGSATIAMPLAPLRWTGLDANWYSATLGAWQDAAGTSVTYCSGLPVIFDDSAAGSTPITVALNSSVSPATLTVSNTTTDYLLTGSGSITGAGTSLTKNGSGVLTLAVPCSFTGGVTNNNGTLQIGNGGASGTLPNLIYVQNNGTLAFNLGANFTWVPAQLGVTGSGNFAQNGTGKITLGNDNIFGISGSQPSQSLSVGPGATLATVKFQAAGSVTLNGGTLLAAGGDNSTYQSWVLARGVTVVPNAVSALIANTGANSGIHILSTNVFDVADGPALDDLVVSARLINPPIEYGMTGGGLTKLGSGRMVLSGANTFTGDTMVQNGALVINGSVARRVIVGNGAMLSGIGTINSNVIIQAGGTLSPGTNVGQLTIFGNLTLGGAMLVQLNKSSSPSNGFVNAWGTLAFGGTLTLTNLGPALTAGDKFYLFNKAGTGAFATTILPPLASGMGWTNKLGTDGSLAVVNTNTTPTSLSWQVSGNNLQLSWPADHVGWMLQAQTNPLSAGLGTNWSIITGSATSNTWTVPLGSINQAVFFRLFYAP